MAERYDRDLTDLFELQDEIAHAIAGAIEPEILKFERERIAERPPQSEDAYELYQRGMWHHYRQTKADNIEAQAYFRRALAIDAAISAGHRGVCRSRCRNAAYLGWAEDAEAQLSRRPTSCAQRRLLSTRAIRTRILLSVWSCMWTRRSERGIAEFEEAIKLNPSFAAAHVMLGQMYLYAGRPEEAVEQAEKGIRLSPSDPRLFIWLPALAGGALPAAPLRGGGRSRAAVVDAQPELAARSALCRRRACPARQDRGSAGGACRTQAARREPGRFRRRLAAGVPDPAAVDHILEGLRKAGMDKRRARTGANRSAANSNNPQRHRGGLPGAAAAYRGYRSTRALVVAFTVFEPDRHGVVARALQIAAYRIAGAIVLPGCLPDLDWAAG